MRKDRRPAQWNPQSILEAFKTSTDSAYIREMLRLDTRIGGAKANNLEICYKDAVRSAGEDFGKRDQAFLRGATQILSK